MVFFYIQSFFLKLLCFLFLWGNLKFWYLSIGIWYLYWYWYLVFLVFGIGIWYLVYLVFGIGIDIWYLSIV